MYFLLPVIPLGILAYIISDQGVVGGDFQWRSRDEAPVQFWFAVAVIVAALLYTFWLVYVRYTYQA